MLKAIILSALFLIPIYSQLVVTLVVIKLGSGLRLIKVSKFDFTTGWNLMPLQLIYFGNLLFGLGGTKSLKYKMKYLLKIY
jgi:solute carrier family 35 protein